MDGLSAGDKKDEGSAPFPVAPRRLLHASAKGVRSRICRNTSGSCGAGLIAAINNLHSHESGACRKTRINQQQEFVIGGYTPVRGLKRLTST
jgi:hypothetical protein